MAEKLAIENLIGGLGDTTPEQTICQANANNRLTVTQKEAASILGYHRSTFTRWKNNGHLVPVEIMPGCFRYYRDTIIYLAEHGYRGIKKESARIMPAKRTPPTPQNKGGGENLAPGYGR